MNLVDSSGWLEYIADGANADVFAVPLSDAKRLIVPSVVVYEVYKVVRRELGDEQAQRALSAMRSAHAAPFTDELAVAAVETSFKYGIPFADSVILATAIARNATLWTQDAHFSNIPDVRFIQKRNLIKESHSRYPLGKASKRRKS